MNRPAVRVSQDGITAYAVYVADDVVSVGRIELFARETLRRVAYRDVTRMLAWDDRRSYVRTIGAFLFASALAAALAWELADNSIVAAVFVTAGFGALALCLYGGRIGGVTRFRLETAHGRIDAALSGNVDKRQLILWDIEQRVLARQDVAPAATSAQPGLFAEPDPFETPDPFLNPEVEPGSDSPPSPDSGDSVSPDDAPATPPS